MNLSNLRTYFPYLIGLIIIVIISFGVYFFTHNEPESTNSISIIEPNDGVLKINLDKPLQIDTTKVADKIVVYYDENKPPEAEYKQEYSSLDMSGTIFELPAYYIEGKWHFAFFNGENTNSSTVQYYDKYEDWLKPDYKLNNVEIQKFSGSYNFSVAFPNDETQK